ncbi:MAG TPA: cytochrome C552 [Flavobacterium sp.]|nr:cytochrome C552 [Flavobacterium sp.]
MKKLLFLLVFFVFLSCGDKKAEPFGKTTDATDVAVDPTLKLGEEIFNGVGLCKTCHLPDKKVIGPSIIDLATIYKEKNGNIVEFLKQNAEPIVDPTQYEVMKTNFALTKSMSDEELKALENYIYSYLK